MNRPVKFFGTVVALATPLWLLNLVLPATDALPKGMPITDLGLAFVPMAAAALLIWREDGKAAVRQLFRRVFDPGNGAKRWWIVVVALLPALYLATYLIYLAMGQSISVTPSPALYMAPLIFLLVFPLAIGEELGYFGYLWDDWERRFGALGGAILFAVPWTALHIPSILQLGKGWDYIALSVLFSAGIRVIWTWMYHQTGGSVFAIITVHAIANVLGSYIQQQYATTLLVLTAIVVAILWGRDLRTWRWKTRQEREALPSK